MEVLQLTTTVDSSGHLHLDIPTQLNPGQVNIVLVINPVVASKDQNLKYDFSHLVGRLNWQGDAVLMQRTLRDEW
ncbi:MULTISPECIES: hypothetical protein [unclassified Anabaena]|uniref:hypothetical protein n=1 Tax=unclassified Anabaena TaxID=2619674 RepID=UPI001447518D|nr:MULTISPECIES: hypothetical protein [unclassified Anabaena]MTJ09991.1 hypothetical protein [Anabaena sp. UHCC 0204]MTJ55726.1 hypothetical protein [Anabaena sp. UHCC 0253]